MPRALAAILVTLTLTACSGETAREVTSAAVGKGVEVGKGTMKGLADGVADGRRRGGSLDGAALVGSWDELAANGDATLLSAAVDGDRTTVTLAVENRSERPLRIDALQVLGLDRAGFVMRPSAGAAPSLTVPPHARERVVVTLEGAQLATVRLFGHDLPQS